MPNANLAVIEKEKIVNYLLNAAHPDNGGKAAFFLELGFNRRQGKLPRAWNLRMDGSMFWKAASNHPAAKPRWCGPSGLWTVGRKRQDW